MKQIFGAVMCFLFGSVLLFFANQDRVAVKELLAIGKLTNATVTNVDTHESEDKDGKMTTFYTPEFSFRDETGSSRTVEQHFSQGNSSTYDYGERVQLLYHPDKPKVGRVNTFWQLHGLSLGLGFFGGVLYLFGFGAIVGAVRVH